MPQPMRPRSRHRRGFTFIELTVVLIIIFVLIALLLPAVQQAREGVRRAQCRNNLMQLGIALQAYAQSHGRLPPGVVSTSGPITSAPVEYDINAGLSYGAGLPLGPELPAGAMGADPAEVEAPAAELPYHHGWIVQILPYIGERNVYHQIDFQSSIYSEKNRTACRTELSVIKCPSSVDGDIGTNYAGCYHSLEAPIAADNNGVLFLNSSIRWDDLEDGLSYTAMAGEKFINSDRAGWAPGTRNSLRNGVGGVRADVYLRDSNNRPNNFVAVSPDADATQVPPVGGFGSSHSTGSNFVLADGSVRFIGIEIDQNLLQRLINRNDGELPSY